MYESYLTSSTTLHFSWWRRCILLFLRQEILQKNTLRHGRLANCDDTQDDWQHKACDRGPGLPNGVCLRLLEMGYVRDSVMEENSRQKPMSLLSRRKSTMMCRPSGTGSEVVSVSSFYNHHHYHHTNSSRIHGQRATSGLGKNTNIPLPTYALTMAESTDNIVAGTARGPVSQRPGPKGFNLDRGSYNEDRD